MDSEGHLYRDLDEKERERIEGELGKPLIPMSEEEYESLKDAEPVKRKNWMRNKPCVCGSGKKFKKCCWSKYT